jgi:hypothetical protein
MVVLVLVPTEEALAEGASVLDRAETVWKVGSILERLEVTPRSASRSATVLDAIDVPRSE